jgi:hypothetical protein
MINQHTHERAAVQAAILSGSSHVLVEDVVLLDDDNDDGNDGINAREVGMFLANV